MSSEIKYIDIHSHLGFSDYGADQSEVINRMKESGVCTITIGTTLEDSIEAVKIAEVNEMCGPALEYIQKLMPNSFLMKKSLKN
jgi:Tat protein secretion system quality control protein TatD with DNase activity